MSTAATILGALLGLGGLVTGVVYYIRRSITNSVDLRQADADLAGERARVAAMDAAAAADRERRAQELSEKTAAVSTAADAAKLLRETITSGQSTDSVPGPTH